MTNDIKDFYSGFGDEIFSKRLNSTFPLRRYAHLQQYKSVLDFVKSGMNVLDAGCGEGTLSIMIAKKGARVTASDISAPNIERAKLYADADGVGDKINFLVADSENLPFQDSSFDLVVSSHVLEHLPDFDQGLQELMRVTKHKAIIAIPTILNGCSLIQVGGGDFWLKRKRSWLALLWGPLRIFWALVSAQEGVDERYAGHDVPHVFRFPWILKRKVARYGFKLTHYEASTLALPLFEGLLPLSRFLDKFRKRKFFRNFGYGTTYVVEKS